MSLRKFIWKRELKTLLTDLLKSLNKAAVSNFFISSSVCRCSNQIGTSNLGENGLQFTMFGLLVVTVKGHYVLKKLHKEFEQVCPKLEEFSWLSKALRCIFLTDASLLIFTDLKTGLLTEEKEKST